MDDTPGRQQPRTPPRQRTPPRHSPVTYFTPQPRGTYQHTQDAVHPGFSATSAAAVSIIDDSNVPQTQSLNSRNPSQTPVITAFMNSHNVTQPGLLLRTTFKVVQGGGDGLGARADLRSAADNFPVLLSDVPNLSDLLSLQQEHFGNTYRYHGLSTDDVLYYSILTLDPEGGRGIYFKLSDCSTPDQWNMAMILVNAIYHVPSTCKSPSKCDLCATPPLLVICFAQEKWEKALKTKNLQPQSMELTFLDGYNDQYAARLREANETKYQLYLKQCGLGYYECELKGLTSLCIAPPNYRKKIPQPPAADHTTEAPKQGRPRKIINITTPQSNASGKAEKAKRSLVSKKPLLKAKPEDFLRTTAKPEGMDKSDEQICITCIQYHRGCKGDKMVLVKLGKGRTELRCANCAESRRKCYWKEVDKGIDNYEKAVDFHEGKRVPANTREGREKKALDRRLSIVDVADNEDGDGARQELPASGNKVNINGGEAGDDSDLEDEDQANAEVVGDVDEVQEIAPDEVEASVSISAIAEDQDAGETKDISKPKDLATLYGLKEHDIIQD